MLHTSNLREDSYRMCLHFFIDKNKGKSERDFLVQEIEECNQYLYGSDPIRFSQSEFENKFRKENPNPKNLPNYESWVKSKMKHFEQLRKINISDCKRVKMDLEIRLNRLPRETKVSKAILIKGKKPNLSERFTIADKTIGLSQRVSELNISSNSKHKLLSLILGCSPINVRQIMNGNYDSKDRKDLIDDFISDLK